MKRTALMLMCMGLAACEAGDNGDLASVSACIGTFSGGAVSTNVGGCSICGTSNGGLAVDGARASYASLRLGDGATDLRATAPSGVVFPAGNFAGALMLIPQSYAPQTQWTVTTYLNGLPQESRTPANASGDDPANPTGTDDFYGFTSSMPFDAVEFHLSGGSPGINTSTVPEIRVYEFCGTR